MMGLYEVILRQSYFGQEIINRFHYKTSADPGFVLGSVGLAEALGLSGLDTGVFPGGTLMGFIQNVQNGSLNYLEGQVANMYVPTDFFTVAFNPTPHGDDNIGGDDSSPAFAYGYVSNRITRSIRAGHKRFAGVSENGIGTGGVIVDGGGELAALAGGLGDTPTFADGLATITCVPVVLAFQEYTTPRGNTAYKQWPTVGEQLDHMAEGVTYSLQADVRTQRSRQYGRGR